MATPENNTKSNNLYSPKGFSSIQAVIILAFGIFSIVIVFNAIEHPKILYQPWMLVSLVVIMAAVTFMTYRGSIRHGLALGDLKKFLAQHNFTEVQGTKENLAPFISVDIYNQHASIIRQTMYNTVTKYYRGAIAGHETLITRGMLQNLDLDYPENVEYLSYAVSLSDTVNGTLYLSNKIKSMPFLGVKPNFVPKNIQRHGDIQFFIDFGGSTPAFLEPLLQWYEKLTRPPEIVQRKNQLLLLYHPRVTISEAELLNTEATTHQLEDVSKIISFFITGKKT